MPYDLPLEQRLRRAGWKAKIHDSERLEPPHLTIYRKRQRWRLGLRDGGFLDRGAHWNQIDEDVRTSIEQQWEALRAEWDRIHPDNPVASNEDDPGN